MNTKTVSGLAMLAVVATPFAASAQSLAEIIAKNPSLAAILAPYMAQSASTASCSGAITKTLTKGMTDSEVVTLQKMLNASADTSVATTGTGSKGMESSYFGAATKAAVIKFQNKYASEVLTPNGLTVGTGAVGAATRAKLNALCATAPTTSTNTGNTTTTTSGELKGGAADLTAIVSTEDVDDKEIYTGQTEKVAAFKLQANGGDAKVTNISVKFTMTAGTGSSYFANYFTGAEISAAGQKIASVSASDLTRESSGVYSITVPVSQVIKQGSNGKTLFNIALTAKESVDSDDIKTGVWAAEITSARFVDTTGVVLSKTLSSGKTITELKDGNTYDHVAKNIVVKRVSSSSDVYTSLSAASNNPTDGKTLEVEKDKTTTVTLGAFSVKATGVKMKYDTVKAKITTTGATAAQMFDTVYLYEGDTQLESVAGSDITSGTEFSFTMTDDKFIEKDSAANLTIKAKVKAIATTTANASVFDQGDSAKLELAKATVVAAKSVSDDKSIETTKGSYDARTAYFRSEGIYYTMSNPTAKSTAVDGDNNDYAEYTMDLKVTNFSDDEVTLALTSGTSTGAFKFASSTGAVTSSVSRVTGGTETAGTVKIASGADATFKLSVTLKGTTGYNRLSLNSITYTDANANSFTVAAAPAEDFRTSEVNIVN